MTKGIAVIAQESLTNTTSDSEDNISESGVNIEGKSNGLAYSYRSVRQHTVKIASNLSPEDQVVQPMPDASPTKWHLAHVTWFFETFLLVPNNKDYKVFDETYCYLFNSYYEAVGKRHPRPARGLLTRPSLDKVLEYREYVDTHMINFLSDETKINKDIHELVILGLAHEEQHQELIFMDILSVFALSPLKPAYSPTHGPKPSNSMHPRTYPAFAGGIQEIGIKKQDEFAFDNEGPRHKVLLNPYKLSSNLVTNGEWLEFINSGGYSTVKYWLSDGWATVRANNWIAPQYWELENPEKKELASSWKMMTLRGLVPLDVNAPVTNISYYEADAFAHWAGKRLPTEAEWEHAMETSWEQFEQVYDSVWQWTSSAYTAHPGFVAAEGAVGEYNGKFMSGQMVLKGGCLATSPFHSRSSYRNFFYPQQRWMFSGLRLAEDMNSTSDELAFKVEVLAGLQAPRKRLSPKWFYDAKGSDLFEDICSVPEYYPTRQEIGIFRQYISEITDRFEDGSILIELGSGASVKTRILLDAAPQIKVYKPVEISQSALDAAAKIIDEAYPNLIVKPVLGDFTKLGSLKADSYQANDNSQKICFFPGSTIGNFPPDEAIALMSSVRDYMGASPKNLFIVGIDLAKDRATLEAAYDDAQGVTAAFNLNILTRINNELNGNFDLKNFAHRVQYNRLEGRVEMHLEALVTHDVVVDGKKIHFSGGETIHTECSYKHTVDGFTAFANRAGWNVVKHWISPEPNFCVFLLSSQ